MLSHIPIWVFFLFGGLFVLGLWLGRPRAVSPRLQIIEHGVRSSIVAIRNPWLRMRLAHMVRAIVVMRIMHQHLI